MKNAGPQGLIFAPKSQGDQSLFLLIKMFFKSFLVGIFGACAMGPIFLLILNRALDKGFWGGFFSATGVALADGIFFSMGLAGSLSVAAHSVGIVRGFEFLGGLILIIFGAGAMFGLRANVNVDRQVDIVEKSLDKASKKSFVWMGLSSFLINISNPMSLVFFATIASKAFPELIGVKLPAIKFIYAGFFAILGSMVVFSLISLFATVISRLLVRRFRVMLEGLTATVFLAIGFYLVIGFFKFAIKSRGIA